MDPATVNQDRIGAASVIIAALFPLAIVPAFFHALALGFPDALGFAMVLIRLPAFLAFLGFLFGFLRLFVFFAFLGFFRVLFLPGLLFFLFRFVFLRPGGVVVDCSFSCCFADLTAFNHSVMVSVMVPLTPSVSFMTVLSLKVILM